jgi:hypothetical protein
MPGRIDVNLGRVGTRAAPTPYGNQRAPDNTQEIQQTFDRFGAMGKAIGNDLGKQLQQKEELEARKAYEAKQDADKVKVSDSLTALKKRGTDEFYGTQQPDSDAAADAAFDERDTQEGYLSKNGANAVEEGTPTFERLEKKRQQLLDALENDDQKKMFLEHSDRLLDGYYGQIESHSARERERQKVDSLKNAESEALRATTLDPANDKLAQESIGNIVGLQDSFTTSVGDAFSKAEDVQGRITMGRLEALLATDGGFVDAERVLEQNKGSLGTKYDDYKKRVDAAVPRPSRRTASSNRRCRRRASSSPTTACRTTRWPFRSSRNSRPRCSRRWRPWWRSAWPCGRRPSKSSETPSSTERWARTTRSTARSSRAIWPTGSTRLTPTSTARCGTRASLAGGPLATTPRGPDASRQTATKRRSTTTRRTETATSRSARA